MGDEAEDFDISEDCIPKEDGRALDPATGEVVRPSRGREAPLVRAAQETGQRDLRGVGEVHARQPISAVVEIMRRKPMPDGKWEPIRPFSPKVEGAKFAFVIMTATTTRTIKRGNIEVPCRDPHPMFAAFNTCHPDLAATLTCRIIHWNEKDAWKFALGAYQHPQGKQFSPQSGWWCRGDAKKAIRWVGGEWKTITCPHRMCEYSQPTFGRGQNESHCKPNLTLLAQFNWRNEKSLLPRSLFQWESKSWNNYANCEGMFRLVRDTAGHLGIDDFPVFGLPFVMTVKETARKGRIFPEVHFSPDGDILEWMQKMNTARERNPQLVAPGPQTLQLAPPEGATADEIDRASQAALDPNYRPANER